MKRAEFQDIFNLVLLKIRRVRLEGTPELYSVEVGTFFARGLCKKNRWHLRLTNEAFMSGFPHKN